MSSFYLKYRINELSYCQKYVSEGGETSFKEYIDWGCLSILSVFSEFFLSPTSGSTFKDTNSQSSL